MLLYGFMVYKNKHMCLGILLYHSKYADKPKNKKYDFIFSPFQSFYILTYLNRDLHDIMIATKGD